MPMAFWGIYQVIVIILMLNLLIAIMNNRFNKVWATSDWEWKYSKSFYQVNYSLHSILPFLKLADVCVLGPIPFFEGSPSISFHLGFLHRAGGLQQQGLWSSIDGGGSGGEEEILPAFEEACANQRAERK